MNRSTGFGKPGRVEIRDLPHELRSAQNEEGRRLKFKKLESLRFEYREEEGRTLLYLVASLKGKSRPNVAWPAYSLRNTSVSLTPHFRGKSAGKEVDVSLPPLAGKDDPAEKSLVGVDFQFPGQKKRRDWF